MPKIIKNLEENLLAEAARQISVSGYNGINMRSIAKACGIALGTVYNYFPSKEHLIVSCMLENWNNCIAAIEAASGANSPRPVAECIYMQLLNFAEQYQTLFSDKSAVSIFISSVDKYHVMLRSQLARPLRKFCQSDFEAEFVAEALLTWTMKEKSFEEIYAVLAKVLEGDANHVQL